MRQTTLPQVQRGAVLATALIILVIITLIGVTASQVTSLEERMAGNFRDRNLAFQAAEAALREGEQLLDGLLLPSFDGTNGLYSNPPAGCPAGNFIWQCVSPFQGGDSDVRVYNDNLHGIDRPPVYIIEQLPRINTGGSLDAAGAIEIQLYRVTAWGMGGNPNTIVQLQTVYRR